MESQNHADAAVAALDGSDFKGRKVRVEVPKSKLKSSFLDVNLIFIQIKKLLYILVVVGWQSTKIRRWRWRSPKKRSKRPRQQRRRPQPSTRLPAEERLRRSKFQQSSRTRPATVRRSVSPRSRPLRFARQLLSRFVSFQLLLEDLNSKSTQLFLDFQTDLRCLRHIRATGTIVDYRRRRTATEVTILTTDVRRRTICTVEDLRRRHPALITVEADLHRRRPEEVVHRREVME